MAEKITYYAIIDDYSKHATRPAGVLRRVVDDRRPVDEAFSDAT